MNVYMTEEEQLEKIRQWFKTYGGVLVFSILFAIVVSFGWNYWRQKQERMYEQASSLFEQVQINVLGQNQEDIQSMSQRIQTEYPGSPYASLAALELAKIAIGNNQLADAEKELFWVVNHTDDTALQNIATIRLARVLIAEQKAPQALDLLKRVKNKEYQSLAETIRADAYLSLNEKNLAADSYQKAVQLMDDSGANSSIAQMKLSNLPQTKHD